jgi:DNA-3-methyladenine glycosylase
MPYLPSHNPLCPADDPFTPDWFERDTVTVAQDLLGHYLVRAWPDTGHWLRARITETEAYTQDDPACHAYQRHTGRAATLYQAPGLAYVYLIYGMYHCLNVVTQPIGTAGAVLFRGLTLVDHSPGVVPGRLDGPGRLCRSLHINTQDFNQQPLTAALAPLSLCRNPAQQSTPYMATPRIGITQATDRLWRFVAVTPIGLTP